MYAMQRDVGLRDTAIPDNARKTFFDAVFELFIFLHHFYLGKSHEPILITF